jgi:hypothetical protein
MSNYIYSANGEYTKIGNIYFTETFQISTDGRCGKNHGGKHCPGTQCCSKDGWCGGKKGKRSDFCYAKNGGKDRGQSRGEYDGNK